MAASGATAVNNLQTIVNSTTSLDLNKLVAACPLSTTDTIPVTCANNSIAFTGYVKDFNKQLGYCVIVNQRIADLNEVMNNSTYVTTLQKEKLGQMGEILASMVNQRMIAQQNYRLNDYHVNETLFYNSFLTYSIIVVNVIFILAGMFVLEKIDMTMFIGCVCALLAIFTIAFLVRVYGNSDRVHTDWTKINMGILRPDTKA